MSRKDNASDHKLFSLVLLRAVAVIAVCLCHYGSALSDLNGAFKSTFEVLHDYGKYGVNIFFVISGFVIPLSFQNGGYQINNYFRFLYKRILRLHPPYLLALVLTLILGYLSYHARHVVYPESPTSIFESLFYLHIPADNPVFWTLAVEAQYYLFIGLFFCVIDRYPMLSVILVIPAIIAVGYYIKTGDLNLLSYIVYFLIGTLGYMIYKNVGYAWLNHGGLVALIIYSFVMYQTAAAIASGIAIILILFCRPRVNRATTLFGNISYSMYLIHFPIAVKMINLVKHKVDGSLSVLILIVVFFIITIISWAFCRLIEHPSELLSRKIKYRQTI